MFSLVSFKSSASSFSHDVSGPRHPVRSEFRGSLSLGDRTQSLFSMNSDLLIFFPNCMMVSHCLGDLSSIFPFRIFVSDYPGRLHTDLSPLCQGSSPDATVPFSAVLGVPH